jgi:hypothetical protein
VMHITFGKLDVPHTWEMSSRREPELLILHDVDNRPTAAACSLCGARMHSESKAFHDSHDLIAAFANEFKRHVAMDHADPAPCCAPSPRWHTRTF